MSNDWYERGELPPVGLTCSVIEDGEPEVYIVAHDQREAAMVAVFKRLSSPSASNPYDCYVAGWFRPIKSEREIAIDTALAMDCEPQEGMLSRRDFVGKLFDAGLLRSKPDA